jgi:hypothetical protein
MTVQPTVWGVGSCAYGSFPRRRVETPAWEAVAEAVREAGIAPSALDVACRRGRWRTPAPATPASQLRGSAGARQVARHRVGLVQTTGGGAAGIDGNAWVVTILSGGVS